MARRRGTRTSRLVDPTNRKTFGEHGFTLLSKTVGKLALNWVRQTAPYAWDKESLLDCMVDKHTRAVLTEAKQLHEPPRSMWSATCNYRLAVFPRVSMVVDWNLASMLAPKNPTFSFPAADLDQIRKIVEIYDTFAEAVYVLHYLHRYATPPAVRALWPTALSLMSKDMVDRFQSGEYAEPPLKLNTMLEYMRATAPLIATALLAPKVEPNSTPLFTIVFSPKTLIEGAEWKGWDAQSVPLV